MNEPDFVKHIASFFGKHLKISEKELFEGMPKRLAELMKKDEEIRYWCNKLGETIVLMLRLMIHMQDCYEHLYLRLKELGEDKLAEAIKLNMISLDQALGKWEEEDLGESETENNTRE